MHVPVEEICDEHELVLNEHQISIGWLNLKNGG